MHGMEDQIVSLIIARKDGIKWLSTHPAIRNMTLGHKRTVQVVSWEEPSDLLDVINCVRKHGLGALSGDIKVVIPDRDSDSQNLLFFAILSAWMEKLGFKVQVLNQIDNATLSRHFSETIFKVAYAIYHEFTYSTWAQLISSHLYINYPPLVTISEPTRGGLILLT